MKQVAVPIHGGSPRGLEVPLPALRPGGVLVRTAYSLISAGTERMVVELTSRSLAGKARSRPDQVKKVITRLRTEGLSATLDTVRARLGSDLPLGYSAAGRVAAVGAGVDDLSVGDAVACAGAGFACHGEWIFVPRNLAVRIPGGLSERHACTVALGAIALQGVRRAEVRVGERVGVVGLGLLGLLTVQILRSAGCHVLAVDLDPAKVRLAADLGAEAALDRNAGDLPAKARAFSSGHGLDAAIVTAASSGSDPTILAASLCRVRGRVVVVGAVGMDLPRNLLYEKELDVRLARSYGPGRYDPDYEEQGRDYPYAFVRFTEGRNMEEYLALLGRGDVDVEPLLGREFGIEEGARAYRFLLSEEGRSAVGLLFSYRRDDSSPAPPASGRRVALVRSPRKKGGVGVGLVGAGAFAGSVLLPALVRLPDFRATGIVTQSGLTSVSAGRRGGFAFATTSLSELLRDEGTDAVIVATRHGDHAELAVRILRAGKDVFVEKPLALSLEELERMNHAVEETGRLLMVGFNRRFAPAVVRLRRSFRGRTGPLHMVYRVNAGAMPPGHWTMDQKEGGGRILGEVCHFVDLLLFLAGAPPERVTAEGMEGDGVSAVLRFTDGSVGTIVYSVCGDPATGKERLEVYGDGTSAELNGFQSLRISSGGRARRIRTAPGKGHRQEVRAFLEAVRAGGPVPIPYGQAAWSTRATLAIMESLSTGAPATLALPPAP